MSCLTYFSGKHCFLCRCQSVFQVWQPGAMFVLVADRLPNVLSVCSRAHTHGDRLYVCVPGHAHTRGSFACVCSGTHTGILCVCVPDMHTRRSFACVYFGTHTCRSFVCVLIIVIIIVVCLLSVSAIVPVLLTALQEPGKSTTVCLEKLLATRFVHIVDAPCLALIMPVIERAFHQRVTDTRKMAAQIMGNMYSLTDRKVSF